MGKAPYQLYLGDCLEVLGNCIPSNSVDAVVCDPPYGLSDHKPTDVVACLTAWLAGEEYRPNKRGFMGRTWDSWVPGPEVWREVFRVLKPGGHVVAFAGSRTHDLMSMALRLAGFENRDTVMWVYGSGFPKSMDVSKAIDKAAGAEREIIAPPPYTRGKARQQYSETRKVSYDCAPQPITTPATDAARQWQGWGTALKPAFEPALLFRKPLVGTVAENVLAHGTGALNIGACRVPLTGDADAAEFANNHAVTERLPQHYDGKDLGLHEGGWKQRVGPAQVPDGRWPANLIHDGSEEVVALFPANAGAAAPVKGSEASRASVGRVTGERERVPGAFHNDTGSAARFFYCAKASRKDRNEGLTSCDAPAVAKGATMREKEGADWSKRNGNHHPTVKPTDLMAYLTRLVTPPGGVVLDPFMGSGSTGKAAMREGFRFIGCELSAEYLEIARARISHEYGKKVKHAA